MIRTQIQLRPAQARRLREIAAQRGVSVAEIVRRCIDLALEEEAASREALYERASRLIGAFRLEGQGDLAENHDAALEDAFG